jgi:hypothetical protein
MTHRPPARRPYGGLACPIRPLVDCHLRFAGAHARSDPQPQVLDRAWRPVDLRCCGWGASVHFAPRYPCRLPRLRLGTGLSISGCSSAW